MKPAVRSVSKSSNSNTGAMDTKPKTGKAGVQTLQRCKTASFVRVRALQSAEGRPSCVPGTRCASTGPALQQHASPAWRLQSSGVGLLTVPGAGVPQRTTIPQRPWGRIRPASSCCRPWLRQLWACGCVTPHLPPEARGAVLASLHPRPKSPFYQDTSPCPGPTLIISAEAGTHSWQGLGVAHIFVGEHSSCCSQQTALAFSDSKMLGTWFLTPRHSYSGSGEAHIRVLLNLHSHRRAQAYLLTCTPPWCILHAAFMTG